MTIAEQILRAKSDYDEVFEAGKRSVEGTLKFTDVESNSYRLAVPNNSERFARVNKIGGMSYKCNNLLPYPYYESTKETDGITFTDNGDGSITVNGTSQRTTIMSFKIFRGWADFILPKGIYYFKSNPTTISSDGKYRMNIAFQNANGDTLVDLLDGGNGKSFTLTETAYKCYCTIDVKPNVTLDNVTFRPMLNEGATALPFEPYFEGLRNTKVAELKSHGVNYLDISAGFNDVFYDDLDGTYIAKANETNGRFSKEIPLDIPIGESIVVYGEPIDGAIVRVRVGNDKEWQGTCSFDGQAYIRHSTADSPITKCDLYISSNDLGVWTRFKSPMISLGKTLLPYKPYVGYFDSVNIPDEIVEGVQSYGMGINPECCNYLDLQRKVYVQKVNYYEFNGSESWRYDTTYHCMVANVNMKCGENTKATLSNTNIPCVMVSKHAAQVQYGTGSVPIENFGFDSVDSWKAHLVERAANGNPLAVVYEIETPIETDISAYLTDEHIEVEGDGTITAVNEYEYAVPTNISYLINTQGG